MEPEEFLFFAADGLVEEHEAIFFGGESNRLRALDLVITGIFDVR